MAQALYLHTTIFALLLIVVFLTKCHTVYSAYYSCRPGGVLSEDHFRVQCDQIQWKHRYIYSVVYLMCMCIMYTSIYLVM